MRIKIINFLPLVIIVLLALTLRLVLLDKIPIGITDDELDFVLNAKAIFFTGKDLTGSWSPLSLSTPPGFPMSELSSLVVSPIIGLLPLSLFSARFPYAIISVLLIIILYLIVERLLGKTQAFIVGLVASINPWSIYFGRTAFDAPLATFFYFLGLYILLIARGWKILLAFIPFSLAFYSYIGTKLLLLPFVSLAVFYAWYEINRRKYLKQYLLLSLLCVATFAYFIFSLQHQKVGGRLGDLASPNHPSISQQVDMERRLSMDTPLRTLLSNKPLVFVKDSINRYLGASSTNFLFLYGEGQARFSVWYHGPFYYFDAIFLLLGLCVIFVKNKKLFFLLLTLLLIAPLPSVASTVGVSYATRSSLMFPILTIFIGAGIWYVLSLRKSKIYKYSLSLILIALYSLLLLNFLNIYLFRNPIYNSEAFAFSARIVSRYVTLAEQNGQQVLVIPRTSSSLLKQHIFYTDSYNRHNVQTIARIFRDSMYEYQNFRVEDCPAQVLSESTTVIVLPNSECPILKGYAKKLTIPQLSDAGEIYRIYNDKVCTKYKLQRYPHNESLSDFEVEKLPEDRFCQKFITILD